MDFFQKIKLRRQIKQHINRPLDINEILSRESDINVVVDTYEFFMRKHHWNIDECSVDCVKVFLLCVLYDGEIANGGISQFLANSNGNYAHQTADALHIIGALDAEAILRKSFTVFKNGIVPNDDTERNKILDELTEPNVLLELDEIAYNMNVFSFCYQYLIANKDQFLATK